MLSAEHGTLLLLLVVDQGNKAVDGSHLASSEQKSFTKFEIKDFECNRADTCGGGLRRRNGGD